MTPEEEFKKLWETHPEANRTRALQGLVAETELYDVACIVGAVIATVVTFLVSLAHMTVPLFFIIVGVGIVLRYVLPMIVLPSWRKKRLNQINQEFPPEP